MAEEFVRFVVPARIDSTSQVASGLLHVAYELVRDHDTPLALASDIRALLIWLEQNLAVPLRFNRTKSKGWYRRETRGICWLRAAAREHLEKLQALAERVRSCGIEVTEIRETRVGYVVYEDDTQVVAEPFRDTRTR